MTPWLTKPDQVQRSTSPPGKNTQPPSAPAPEVTQGATAEAPEQDSEQEPIPLADLQDADLTLGQVAIYLAELLSTRVPVHILVKSFAEERPNPGLPLKDLLAAISSGEVRSAQLRYRYQNSGWIDTLIASSRGVRLVRTALP